MRVEQEEGKRFKRGRVGEGEEGRRGGREKESEISSDLFWCVIQGNK